MRTIAIEEHFSTPMFQAHSSANEFRNFYLASRSEYLGHSISQELADLGESRIAHMDAAGIDVQILSFTSPGPQAFDASVGMPLARDANDRLHEAMRRHPKRFAGFAALPTADPQLAAKELERTVKKLGFKGAMIHGSQQGSFLDQKKYWVLWECAQELDVPIYLHPALPAPAAIKAYFEGYEDLARAAWGFAVDTSIHFLRIVFAGVFDAYPGLKIILGHLGEGLPFAMHRLNEHSFGAAARRGLRKQPIDYLRENLFVTTSGNAYEPALVCTLLALGADKILFAADWPYEANKTAAQFLRSLSISELDRAKLAHLNAERLFGL
jgi:predicted TIM-barrel fold metal-dependent hydrolase